MFVRRRDILGMQLTVVVSLFLAGCTEEIDHDQILQKQLIDPSADQRWNATLSLKEMRPVPQTYVEPLLKALDDEDSRVRQTAAEALGELGAPGRTHINTILERSSKHPDAHVRFALEQAVAKINRSQ